MQAGGMNADVGYIPGTSPTRQSQKEATRQRVLAAARDLFGTHSPGHDDPRDRASRRCGGGQRFHHLRVQGRDPLRGDAGPARPAVRGTRPGHAAPTRLHGRSAEDDVRHPLRVRGSACAACSCRITAAFDWTLPPGARPYGRTPRLRRSSVNPDEGYRTRRRRADAPRPAGGHRPADGRLWLDLPAGRDPRGRHSGADRRDGSPDRPDRRGVRAPQLSRQRPRPLSSRLPAAAGQ